MVTQLQRGGYTAPEIGAPGEMARLEPHAQSLSPPGLSQRKVRPLSGGTKLTVKDMPVFVPSEGGTDRPPRCRDDVNLRASMVVPGGQGGFSLFPRDAASKTISSRRPLGARMGALQPSPGEATPRRW